MMYLNNVCRRDGWLIFSRWCGNCWRDCQECSLTQNVLFSQFIDEAFSEFGNDGFSLKKENFQKKRFGKHFSKTLYLFLFREIHFCYSATWWNMEEAEAGEGWLYSTGRSASVSVALPSLQVYIHLGHNLIVKVATNMKALIGGG